MYSGLISANQLKFSSISGVINQLLPYLFYGAGILLIIYLVIGGLEMLTSAGDPKKIELAQKKITGAIIGFIIIFVAYWLTQAISKILGLENLPI